MTNMFDLSGRVALVSGAASGMGRSSSLALAEAGADVVLADLNEEGTQAVAAEIAAFGRRTLPVRCDISRPEEIRSMFGRIDEQFGRIDFVANIAGEAVRKKPEEISLDEVEWTWRNLVYGRFCMCQEAGRRMLAAGQGSIVNLGSLASITALGRGHIAYSMAMGERRDDAALPDQDEHATSGSDDSSLHQQRIRLGAQGLQRFDELAL